MKVDNKTDVYSFGVVTMEVIMGRHPGELISSLLSSASFSSSTSLPVTTDHWLLNDVMDKRPSPPMDEVGELEVVVAVKIALACLCGQLCNRLTEHSQCKGHHYQKRFP